MSDIDITCFGNQRKVKHSVIDFYSREDIKNLKVHRREEGHLSGNVWMGVNIKLRPMREKNMGSSWIVRVLTL